MNERDGRGGGNIPPNRFLVTALSCSNLLRRMFHAVLLCTAKAAAADNTSTKPVITTCFHVTFRDNDSFEATWLLGEKTVRRDTPKRPFNNYKPHRAVLSYHQPLTLFYFGLLYAFGSFLAPIANSWTHIDLSLLFCV